VHGAGNLEQSLHFAARGVVEPVPARVDNRDAGCPIELSIEFVFRLRTSPPIDSKRQLRCARFSKTIFRIVRPSLKYFEIPDRLDGKSRPRDLPS